MRHLLDARPTGHDYQVGMGRAPEIEIAPPVRARALSCGSRADGSQVQVPVGAREWSGKGFHGREGRSGAAQGAEGGGGQVGKGAAGAGGVAGNIVGSWGLYTVRLREIPLLSGLPSHHA